MAGSSFYQDEDAGGGTISDINVTPLVDVVLVLLIIFMVTAKLIVARGIVPTELDTIPMFMAAELQLLIVSGGLAGKVQTYALVDEVVPPE